MARVILFNKPFGILSQFSDSSTASSPSPTLSSFIPVPEVYPAGRLDKDSEGLMILTDDGRLQARITSPRARTEKTYWAQVEGVPDDASIDRLRAGVTLKDGRTRPCDVRALAIPEAIWPRDPPIRYRKSVPDSWLELTLTEGRNRQVRRMTAHIGYPTLRLIRVRVGNWHLNGLAPGDWRDASS